MAGYKEPSFQDRVALAQSAREKALEKLRNKPQVDEAERARRAAAQQTKLAEAAARRAAVLEAREAEKAAAEAEKAARAAEIEAAKPPVLTDEERKALRDAKYAARKKRKK